MNNDDIDFMIQKLTELLIKQDMKDKKDGVAYIKKIEVYRDLINLLKNLRQE